MRGALMENESMAWHENVEAALLEVNAALATPAGPNRDTAIKARRTAAADVIAAHAALKKLLPTSDLWHLHKLGFGTVVSTERLLSWLIDSLVECAKVTGIMTAVRDCDTLLTDGAAGELQGYDLTFFEGLKIAGRWDLAEELYVAPFETVRKQLRPRLIGRYDPFALKMDPEHTESLSVLVREFSWGPAIVALKGRASSDRILPKIDSTPDHGSVPLVTLLAVTVRLPLPVRVETQLVAPWVEELLNIEGGVSSHFPPASPLMPLLPMEVRPGTKRASEQAFGQWASLSQPDREALALAVKRLAASLSRGGELAAHDRVLDISIALEILYRLDPGEIIFKLSLRAGWYLRSNVQERVKIKKELSSFYGLRSRIVHGRISKPSKPNRARQETVDRAFEIARETLLKHLERRAMPSDEGWRDIVLGATQEAIPPKTRTE